MRSAIAWPTPTPSRYGADHRRRRDSVRCACLRQVDPSDAGDSIRAGSSRTTGVRAAMRRPTSRRSRRRSPSRRRRTATGCCAIIGAAAWSRACWATAICGAGAERTRSFAEFRLLAELCATRTCTCRSRWPRATSASGVHYRADLITRRDRPARRPWPNVCAAANARCGYRRSASATRIARFHAAGRLSRRPQRAQRTARSRERSG